MAKIRVAGVIALTLVLGACDRTTIGPDITAPDHGAPVLNAVPDGGFGTTADGPFDEVFTPEDPSAQQAATGGRASGHVGFTFATPFLGVVVSEKYSFVALSTEPPPPFAAKGQYEFHVVTTTVENRAHGEVICLSIVGNRARVAGVVRKLWVNNVQRPLPPAGLFNFWTVQDNGEGQDPPDLASLVRFASEAAARFHCAVGVPLEQLPNQEGNIQVSSQ